MRLGSLAALVSVAVAISPSAVRTEEPTELRQLKAENAELKNELAKSRSQVQALETRLAELTTVVRQLRADVERLKAEAGRQGGLPAATTGPASKPAQALRSKLDIRVAPGDWGDADRDDIQKVLLSAAGELWQHFRARELRPIIVKQGSSGPSTFYEEGPNGEYVVTLDVKDMYWGQFAYQFAHEFCHVLAGRTSSSRNQWFVESLCEAASIHAVKQMGVTWKTSPPLANWKSYAASLTRYAEGALSRPSDELGSEATLVRWYAQNHEKLRKDPYLREKNRTVAKKLLPLFEKNPKGWEAVGYLNIRKGAADDSLDTYLLNWHAEAPAEHKPFVKGILDLFGVGLPARSETRP